MKTWLQYVPPRDQWPPYVPMRIEVAPFPETLEEVAMFFADRNRSIHATYTAASARFMAGWFHGIRPYYVRVGIRRRVDLLIVAWQLVRLFFRRDWTAGAPAGREMPTWRTGMTPDE